MNWLVQKLTQGQVRATLGQVRAQRRFDPNNYERALNDLTGRLTTSQSQKLQTSRGIGGSPWGLIVGGQVGGGGTRISVGVRQGTPYINPVTGTQILPGNTKTQSGGSSGGGSRERGDEGGSPVGTSYVTPKKAGAGGLPMPE